MEVQGTRAGRNSVADLKNSLLEYGITIAKSAIGGEGAPDPALIAIVQQAVHQFASAMGGPPIFRARLGGVRLEFRNMKYGGLAFAHAILLNPDQLTAWTVVHEMAHTWDAAHRLQFASEMQKQVNAGYLRWYYPILHILDPNDQRYWYLPGSGPPPCGIDRNFNAREDFAEAVTAFIFPEVAAERARTRGWPYQDPARGYSYPGFRETPRGRFIQVLLATGLPARNESPRTGAGRV